MMSGAVDVGILPEQMEQWKEATDRAVEFASGYPEHLQPSIVQAVLISGLRPVGSPGNGNTSGVASAVVPSGLEAVAVDVGADTMVLRRFIEIDDDGEITLRMRIDGRSIAERQNLYSLVYAYVHEKATGELDVDGEALRRVCQEHRCYDSNFTANLRNGGYLLEHGGRGSPNKSYRIAGEAASDKAREIIRDRCQTG